MNHAGQKATLADLYRAAVAAVAPGPALTRALDDDADRVVVIALGKAAPAMAEAAVAYLSSHGRTPAGGLLVAPSAGPAPHPSIAVLAGDHPEPGAGSLAAAEALDRLVRRVPAGDTVWILLSGGTTSLLAAPQPGIPPADLTALYARLLRSGLDIARMNLVRKRFTRWSGGRLAQRLAHARVRCYVVSDVVGDDLAAIGSGPCVPDPSTARDVRDVLAGAGLWDALAPSLRAHLDAVLQGRIPETPKPGDPAFAHVETRVVASNRMALDAAERRARDLGLAADVDHTPLAGEASATGARIADRLLRPAANIGAAPCLILGGETTVTIDASSAGRGGRSQELALAAARVLDGASRPVALLAAGTDGRDGPTDAAGAIVDDETWRTIAAAGRDPERDLLGHDAYPALAAAHALLETGPTGTNVMDVVIGLR